MKKKKFLKILAASILVVVLFFSIYAIFFMETSKTEGNKIYCKESQRNAEACIQIYQPVCGYVQVDCVTEPCELQPQTFGNSCIACSNGRVEYYIEGEC